MTITNIGRLINTHSGIKSHVSLDTNIAFYMASDCFAYRQYNRCTRFFKFHYAVTSLLCFPYRECLHAHIHVHLANWTVAS